MRSYTFPLGLALILSSAGAFGQDGPKVDVLDFVQAPGNMRVEKGAKVGYAIETLTKVAGQEIRVSTAIVGETKETWKLETDQVVGSIPQLKGHLLALELRKSDGRVLKAQVGKPGEALRDVKIGPEIKKGKDAEGKAVELTLSTALGGPHKAKLFEGTGIKSYSGVSGELAGLPLKVESVQGDFELEAMPAAKTITIGGKELAVRVLSFTNDTETVITKNPVITALSPYIKGQGLVSTKTSVVSIAVVKLATNHKPALTWP